MKSIKDEIYKQIDSEVKSSIEEIDLDKYINPKKIKQIIDLEVHSYIVGKVGEQLQLSVYNAIRKIKPQTDYLTEQKAREFIEKLTEPTKETRE